MLARFTLRTPFCTGRTVAKWLPLLAALLFALHPVQTQAVTYVVQRLASLATMFYLLSVVCYIRARLSQEERGSLFSAATIALFALSLISALLAMTTKEISATLPLVVAVYEFSFFRVDARKKLMLLAPLLLTMLIVPLGMLRSGRPLGELLSDVSELTRESHIISRGDYLLTQFSVISTYIRLLFLPIDQNLDYDYPVYHSLFTPQVLFGFLLLVALFGTGIYLYYRSGRFPAPSSSELPDQTESVSGSLRIMAFGIFWFFIALTVESSLIPITDVIFEHRLYLPSVGAFITLAGAALLIIPKAPAKGRVALIFLALVTLTAVTWQRNQVWGDSVSLWNDVIEKSPKKMRGYNNVVTALLAKGRTDEAIEKLQAALTIEPDNASAHRNLGSAFDKQGLIDKAIEQYELSLRLQPGNIYTLYNLGIVYDKKGLEDKAAEYFKQAIALKKDYVQAHNNLGVVHAKQGRLDSAVSEFEIALKYYPDFSDASKNLAFAFAKQGLLDKAVEQFKYTVTIDRNNAEAHLYMAQAYSEKGLDGEALTEYRTASSLSPGNAEVHYRLGVAYAKSGAREQAIEELQNASKLEPYNAVYLNDLARAQSSGVQ